MKSLVIYKMDFRHST